MRNDRHAGFALLLLFAINAVNFYDRQVLSALAEPLRKEWTLSDGALGILNTAFIFFYAAAGMPLGRMADRWPRKWILAGGVLIWSVFTAASGLARSYWQLFALRLGVGAGEASCAPAAASLIGDIFPPERRGRAMSIFMLGLPAGIAVSYFVSGRVAHAYDWRAAFFVAGIPGVLCALAALALREPVRGGAEARGAVDSSTGGSTLRAALSILAIPTMRWVILSGVFINFSLYALGTFLVSFLQRYHSLDLRRAGDVSMVVSGVAGVPGLLLGGVIADRIARRRRDGRPLLAAVAALASAPLIYLALERPRGDMASFTLLMASGSAFLYAYYPSVYPAILDVVEPARRGTAMAVYFLAMYALGAALGPWAIGALSDHFAQSAASAAGVAEFTSKTLEPFRAEGLRSALRALPLLSILLAAVLYAASRTIRRDARS